MEYYFDDETASGIQLPEPEPDLIPAPAQASTPSPLNAVIPTPADLGFPVKFQAWSPHQWETIEAVALATQDVAVNGPTGVGKSAIYMGAAVLTGARCRIVTETIALQEQLYSDFGILGARLLKGKSNYPCPHHGNCDTGHEETCPNIGTSECAHTVALEAAAAAPIVITNYAWHTTSTLFGQTKVPPPDLLILDEAHSAMDAVSSTLTVELTESDIFRLGMDLPYSEKAGIAGEYSAWAKAGIEKIKILLQTLTGKTPPPVELDDSPEGAAYTESVIGRGSTLGLGEKIKGNKTAIRALKKLRRKLGVLMMATDDWVYRSVHKASTTSILVTPIWPKAAARRLLAAPKVVALSATITGKGLELIGWKPGTYDFIEIPSPFDPELSPVLWIPTTFVSFKWNQSQIAAWLRRIDEILGRRQHVKGIIHPTSFSRAKLVYESSQYRRDLILPTAGTTATAVKRFKASSPPSALLSPSVTTGYDFPGDTCRYQIIAKIPFPDRSDFLVDQRAKSDPTWYTLQTVDTLIQTTGRGTRSRTDWCENFVIDNMVQQIVERYRHFIPRWWMDRYRRISMVSPIANTPRLRDLVESGYLLPHSGGREVWEPGTLPQSPEPPEPPDDLPF